MVTDVSHKPALTDVERRKKKIRLIKKMVPFYLMALPGIIYLFINNYMPLPGIVLAFKTYNVRNGIFGSAWAGLKNFEFLFATNDAWLITRNTIGYNIAFIIVNLVLSVTIAIILSELTGKLKKFYQSAILLPYMLSSVIISYLVFGFLSADNGFINNSILAPLGLPPVRWYTEKGAWPFILVFVNAWKSVGYNCVIYLATILGFDKSLYEAAAIDGASKWRQITKITLPMLRPIIIMLTLMAFGAIFYSDFGLFYQVPQNSGALYPVTNTIDTYIYRGLVERGDVSMSAAAGFYQSIVGFILILAANGAVRKLDLDSSLF